MKKKYLLIIPVIAIGAASTYFYRTQSGKTELANPKRGPLKESIYGLGTVRSNRVFEYKHGVTSHIAKLYVKEGDIVTKDQLLIDLSESRPLRAPFAGTVTSVLFHEGENVFPQMPIIKIEDLQNRYIEVALEQQGALRVRSGQVAKLSFESLRGTNYEGTVDSMYPSGGQFLVRIESRNLPKEILPGMTADVAILISERPNVLMVPMRAVISGRLTVLNSGKKERIEIKAGISDGEWLEVLSPDIALDSQIVMTGK